MSTTYGRSAPLLDRFGRATEHVLMIGPLLVAGLLAVPATAESHVAALQRYRRGEPHAIEAVAKVAEADVRRELDAMRRLARSRRRSQQEEAALATYPFAA